MEYDSLVLKVQELEAKVNAPIEIKPNEEFGLLEQRVTVLETLVKQLDDLILKNEGFVPSISLESTEG